MRNHFGFIEYVRDDTSQCFVFTASGKVVSKEEVAVLKLANSVCSQVVSDQEVTKFVAAAGLPFPLMARRLPEHITIRIH